MMTQPPLHVLLLPLLLPLLASPVSALPLFSWSTLPVYTHTCNATGPFNEAAITALARYPLVTVEKGQGVFETPTSGAGGAEARIAQALAAVKAANASAFTLFYYNSILSWDMYDLGAFLEANPSLCLQNRTGGCVRIPGDPAFPQPKNGLNVFDFTNPKVFSLWVDECVGLTSKYAGAVDGCFADRADNVTGQGWAHTLDPAKMEAYAEAHEQAMISVQAGLNASLPGSVLVSNHIVVPGVTATMIEAFAATEASISELLAFAATGAIVEVHPGYSEDGSDNYCEEITNSLAAFLIGAGEGSYYHCSRGWISNSSFPDADDEWLTWREEYDRPLGAPTGPAVKTGAVYTRGFASGTHVRFDTTTNTGTITWAGGEVQKGDVAPRKGHEEGRAKGVSRRRGVGGRGGESLSQ
jgi:hypothetical protein